MKHILISCFALFTLFSAVTYSEPATLNKPEVVFSWASKDFDFLVDAIKFMNSLTGESKASCYVIALSSARTGWGNGYYSVVYKKF